MTAPLRLDVTVNPIRKAQPHLDPALVILYRVTGDSHQLHVPLSELRCHNGHSAKLSGAYWGVVRWVGEQDAPSEEKKKK